METKHILAELDVSCETINCLKKYLVLLEKWNKSINLVSKNSLKNAWDRHILDSAQLLKMYTFGKNNWVDFGSGAGFPGMVIAIIAAEKNPNLRLTLIDSDKRKCVFLREIRRELNLNLTIIDQRIENCSCLNADIISARALATMDKLLFYFELHSNVGCKGLFLKGKVTKKELQKIPEISKYNINIESSLIDDSSVIVIVEKRNFETEKNY